MVAEMLREQGMHVTAQRLAVLRAVSAAPHSTTDEIVGSVRDDIGTVSRQAVYDTVNTLADRGILQRIQPVGSPARYEVRPEVDHHHLICRSCGSVEDIMASPNENLRIAKSETQNYVVEHTEVIFWGQCPKCQREVSKK